MVNLMSCENGQIRLGFIGCGSHSTANLYPCLRWVKEIDFIATCDLKEELAKKCQDDWRREVIHRLSANA